MGRFFPLLFYYTSKAEDQQEWESSVIYPGTNDSCNSMDSYHSEKLLVKTVSEYNNYKLIALILKHGKSNKAVGWGVCQNQ